MLYYDHHLFIYFCVQQKYFDYVYAGYFNYFREIQEEFRAHLHKYILSLYELICRNDFFTDINKVKIYIYIESTEVELDGKRSNNAQMTDVFIYVAMYCSQISDKCVAYKLIYCYETCGGILEISFQGHLKVAKVTLQMKIKKLHAQGLLSSVHIPIAKVNT